MSIEKLRAIQCPNIADQWMVMSHCLQAHGWTEWLKFSLQIYVELTGFKVLSWVLFWPAAKTKREITLQGAIINVNFFQVFYLLRLFIFWRQLLLIKLMQISSGALISAALISVN